MADAHLRFWLSFIGPNMPAIERGRGDQVLAVLKKRWNSWRGRAIEPVVRQSLLRLPAGTLPGGTDAVGGYWTRTNDPEIDLVGADRAPIAKKVTMVGSIKWHENKPFDGRASPGSSSTEASFLVPTTVPRCSPYPAPVPPPATSHPLRQTTCSPHGNPPDRAKPRTHSGERLKFNFNHQHPALRTRLPSP